jgi:hypothetical protein
VHEIADVAVTGSDRTGDTVGEEMLLRMTTERCKWMCGWLLALAACELEKGDGDDPVEGSSDVDTGAFPGSESVTATSTSGYDPSDTESCSTFGDDSTLTATATSATTYGSSDVDTGGTGEGGGGAAEQCGVELVYDGSQTSFMCACEDCSVQYDGISGASGEALINACECICDVFDCGGSVSGGVTTNAEDDGGSWSGTGESGGGEVDSGWETDSASGTGTSTTGYGDDDG